MIAMTIRDIPNAGEILSETNKYFINYADIYQQHRSTYISMVREYFAKEMFSHMSLDLRSTDGPGG